MYDSWRHFVLVLVNMNLVDRNIRVLNSYAIFMQTKKRREREFPHPMEINPIEGLVRIAWHRFLDPYLIYGGSILTMLRMYASRSFIRFCGTFNP
jgi:hypothetical protein